MPLKFYHHFWGVNRISRIENPWTKLTKMITVKQV